MYATGMLKRVEGRLDMERHYRVKPVPKKNILILMSNPQLILSFSSLMHLTAFFLVTVAGIFIDQLFIGRIRLVARHVMTYEIVFLFLIALTVPWLWIGLASTRKEHRIGMVVFFGISLGFMAIWGSMFGSSIYRFMFFTWSFFAVMSVSTCIMLVILIILSVLVFLNFGLGLPEYLHTPIPEHPADKVPWMIEAGNEKPELFVDSPVNTTSRTLSHKYDDSFDSKLSLATSPGQTRDFPNMESIQEPMPPIPLPATPTPVLVLSNEAVSSRRSEESEPVFPPGLGASPRGSPKGSSRRLPVPKSRWSTTTVGTEAPPTPSDVSRHSSTKKVGNASRWSTSTTATTTTNTSGLSEADIPPVPEMPQLPPVPEMPRLPQVAELVRPLPALPKKNII
ncbi:hypothetical protein FRC20_008569 [Serendipita sp. 405]|nr:hypothetical protein FRC20_008569 [Serendipita sp. 405]